MRARNWQTILGAAALLATLALTSPGVQLARAGEDDAPKAVSSETAPAVAPKPEPSVVALPAEGPVCGAAAGAATGSPSEVAVIRLQQQLAARAAALAAASAHESSESEGMALNNRGYYYGNPRAPHPR